MTAVALLLLAAVPQGGAQSVALASVRILQAERIDLEERREAPDRQRSVVVRHTAAGSPPQKVELLEFR
jgi:hypothetical protein